MTTPKVKKPVHPLEVNLGFKKFKIIQASLNKENLHGCVEFANNTLTIDPNMCIEDYKWTLLHEICHIGFDLFGLGDDEEMPQIGNEYLTSVTSNMLQLLWGLNKELFEFIFEEPR